MSASLEPGVFRRGPGGRPTRQEAERRHRELLETTKRLLLERGWEATSIDEISRRSGVAKRFLYARYPDRGALFMAAIAQFRDDKIDALAASGPPPDDIEEGLLALGRQMLDTALGEDALAIARLFFAEASRLRQYAKAFIESRPNRGLAAVERVLAAYAERGDFSAPDLQLAAEQFFILVVGAPQRIALLVGRETPERETRWLRGAVALFLDGYRRRGV